MRETKAPQPLHRRSIEHQTWMHSDGLLEIESRLLDTRAYDCEIGIHRALPAGEPVHDMTIRILLGPDRLIRHINVRMDSAPFAICAEITQRFEALRGACMGRGWNRLLSERFAGAGGCRHLLDLLRGMGTVVFQSLHRSEWSRECLAQMADSCHAFRQDSQVMVQLANEINGDDDLEN
jgi:hypothetical protein